MCGGGGGGGGGSPIDCFGSEILAQSDFLGLWKTPGFFCVAKKQREFLECAKNVAIFWGIKYEPLLKPPPPPLPPSLKFVSGVPGIPHIIYQQKILLDYVGGVIIVM